MIFDLFMAMAGRYHGRRCRQCTEAIQPTDGFAMGEGVCRPCAAR